MSLELKLANTDYDRCFSNGVTIDQFPGLSLPQISGKPHQGEMSAIFWYSSIEHFVFGDGSYIYGVTVYDDTLYLNWFIIAKCHFHGFVIHNDNIYTQDGPVLSQYNIAKVDSEGKSILERELTVPDNSICLLTGYPPSAGDYLSPNAPAFSGPVIKPPQDVIVGPKENLIFILANTGSIYASNASLSYIVAGCHNPPDSLAVYLQQNGNNTTLYYRSGGQIIAIDGNSDNFPASTYALPAGMSPVDWITIAIDSADVQPRLTSFPQQEGLKVVFTKLTGLDAVNRFAVSIGNPRANAAILMMIEFGQVLPAIDSTGTPQNGPLATTVSSILLNSGNALSGVFISPPYIVQRGANFFYSYGVFRDGQGNITLKKIRLPNKQNFPELTAVWANAWNDSYLPGLNTKVINYLNTINQVKSVLWFHGEQLDLDCCECWYFEKNHSCRPDCFGSRKQIDNLKNELNTAQANYDSALTLYNNGKNTVARLTQNIDITSTDYLTASLTWEVLKNVYQSATDRKIIGI